MNEDKSEILLSFIQFAPDSGKKVLVPVIYADENAVYIDENGKEYAGKELINGMEFICDDTDNNSDVLYFKKK